MGGGGFGHSDDSVEPVVVGEGEGVEAEPGCLLQERFGAGGAVEKTEVGVRVQFGVGNSVGLFFCLRV